MFPFRLRPNAVRATGTESRAWRPISRNCAASSRISGDASSRSRSGLLLLEFRQAGVEALDHSFRRLHALVGVVQARWVGDDVRGLHFGADCFEAVLGLENLRLHCLPLPSFEIRELFFARHGLSRRFPLSRLILFGRFSRKLR